MSGSASFSWIGTTSGAWNTPANWADVTTGQTPAASVPGSLDDVIIGRSGYTFTLSGDGTAAGMSFQASDDVTGDLNAGTLTVGSEGVFGQLDILAGATVSATVASLDGSIVVSGSAATLRVGELLQSSGTPLADLSATDGGRIAVGSLTLGSAAVTNVYEVDSTSLIEIGSAGTGAVGTITVDQGATLPTGTLAADAGTYLLYGNLADDGLISGGGLYLEFGTLSGSGTIAVVPDGTLRLWNPVITSGLSFQLGDYADFYAEDTIAAGNTIAMAGDGVLLSLGSGALMNGATVTGFNSSDTLQVGTTFDGVTFSPGSGGGAGTLTVTDGATAVATISLAGDYSGDTFEAVAGGATGQIVVVPSGLAQSNGTSTQNSYVWIGPSGGDWNDTANWEDVTAGQTAAVVAPGSLDVATIVNGGIASALLTGNGSAASLTVLDNWTVVGDLNVGTLVVGGAAASGDLTINSAGTPVAGGGAITAGSVTDLGTIAGVGYGSLLVGGTLQVGSASLAATLSGRVQTAALVLSDNPGNFVDASAGIVVGNVASSSDVGLLIEPGFTLPGQGSVVGPIVDNGLIAGGNLTLGQANGYEVSLNGLGYGPPFEDEFDFTTALSGTGTVEVQSGGTISLAETVAAAGLTFQLDGTADLDIQASIAAGNTIDLIGNMNTITVDAKYYSEYTEVFVTPGMPIVGATINGFNSTDTVIILGDTVGNASYAAGTLSLLNTNTLAPSPILTLNLAGMNAATTFAVGRVTQPAGAETQQAITVACFAAGTRIATPRGAIAIERLHEGDTVLTVSGRKQPIRWIGRRSLDCRRHPAPEQIIPVRIVRHAFGENLPKRALLLSPDHAVFIDDVLIPVKHLVNGTTIARSDVATITYYHLELPRHDVVLAEGLPTESYLETGGRSNFENGGGAMRLYPNFAADLHRFSAIWEYAGYAPLIVTGDVCDRVRARLAVQALMLGYQGDGRPLRARRRAGR